MSYGCASDTSEMSCFIWKPCTPGNVPENAVKGGRDSDGSDIYVGKANHGGDVLPAKVIPRHNVAYVAYGGQEHTKYNVQVLCEQRFEWTSSSNGRHVPNAVPGGNTANGETLYVGRVRHEGALTVGKVHPSHRCCYISYGGREIPYNHYEILTVIE